MSKYRATWNSVLIMASFAAAFLVIPPDTKARMIASRMQSGKLSAAVRGQLCSEIVQQELRRFGLSGDEARQLQNVFSDERVIREIVELERKVAHTGRATIERHMTDRLMTALQSSVDRQLGAGLRQKLTERAKRIPGNQRLIASRASVRGGAVDARKVLAQAQRELTAETLVALGMSKKEAAETTSKLKNTDIDSIFKGNLRIGYPAGIDFTSGDGQILLLIIILGIVAIIAGGAVAVVFLVVVLIALVYYLGEGHW